MFTKPFSQLSKTDADIAGGKGASLGEMLQSNIPVPDGYVVLSTTFDEFLHKSDLAQEIDSILESVDHKTISSVESASEKIQELIKHASMPDDIKAEIESQFSLLNSEFVAVRSSATAEDGADHAWAGQLESYLNTTKDTLLEKVQHCWASLFTPRAIFYRFEKGLHTTKISVAVVVQKMVNSEKSGIAFSVHPVTEDRNQIIIEAGFGLGEAIVSGSVTPDSYVIEKEPRRIIDINVSNQTRAMYRKTGGGNEWLDIPEKGSTQVFNDSEILALSEIIMTIENHYGFPCDIEWAYENGKFYIVQSRPITTLRSVEEEVSVEGIVPSEYKFYGLWKGYLFANWFWTNWSTSSYLERIKLDLQDGGVFVVKGGNFFLKKSTVQTIKDYIVALIEQKDMSPFNEMRKISDEIFSQSIADIKSMDPNAVTPEIISQVSEIGRKIMFPWTFGYQVQKVFDELLTTAAKDSGVPVEKISTLMPEYDTPLMESQKKLRDLKNMLKNSGYWDKLLENPESAISEIKADSAITTELNSYSENYSWVGIMNLVGDPLTIEQVLEQITHLVEKKHEEKELLDIDDNMKFLVDAAATAGYMPQLGVEYYAIYSQYAMVFYKNAATQLGITYRELLDLNLDEIIAGLKGVDVKSIIARRQNDNWAIYTVPGKEPKVIDNKELVDLLFDKMVPKVEVSEDGSIVGQVGNKGIAQGRVKVILAPEEFSKMESGDVLVTTMTTPDYVPLMNKASAIITDIGGLLCHAAIISRELNKPCIIDAKFATQILKDGDEVEVDANNGVVKIISSKKSVTWEKVLQRNFPPLAWTAGGYYEFHGLSVGPMTWIREREMQVKYNTVQSYMIQDPNAFYTTNINELIQEKDIEFENAIDIENQKVMEIVEMLPGNSLSDLHELNEKHKLAYGLMLIGFDVAIDIRNQIDKTIKSKDEGFEAYLATPWKPTAIQREQFAATQAEQDIKNNPDNKNQILQKLANDFGYIHQDYLGQPWTALDYEKSFDDNITLQSGMDESYDLSKLSEYEAWLVTIFKKMTYMYEEGRNAMVRTVWAMKETAKQIGLSPETLLYMTAGEVEQYSLGKMEPISDDLVAIRKKYFAVHFDNGIYSDYSGEAEVKSLIGREKIEFIWQESNEVVDTLKGSIAFKGYAKGKVRLVFTQDDANQVQEGEILVSPMTQVEFLSGIRKCGAIVTDEGGIICHAAIVSREFSKPCILATRKATKVLKNGDLVEVDANKGIVTKLS